MRTLLAALAATFLVLSATAVAGLPTDTYNGKGKHGARVSLKVVRSASISGGVRRFKARHLRLKCDKGDTRRGNPPRFHKIHLKSGNRFTARLHDTHGPDQFKGRVHGSVNDPNASGKLNVTETTQPGSAGQDICKSGNVGWHAHN